MQFARHRLQRRLCALYPATGEYPPRSVALLHHKHPALCIHHNRAHAQRHAPGHTPQRLQHKPVGQRIYELFQH